MLKSKCKLEGLAMEEVKTYKERMNIIERERMISYIDKYLLYYLYNGSKGVEIYITE